VFVAGNQMDLRRGCEIS